MKLICNVLEKSVERRSGRIRFVYKRQILTPFVFTRVVIWVGLGWLLSVRLTIFTMLWGTLVVFMVINELERCILH